MGQRGWTVNAWRIQRYMYKVGLMVKSTTTSVVVDDMYQQVHSIPCDTGLIALDNGTLGMYCQRLESPAVHVQWCLHGLINCHVSCSSWHVPVRSLNTLWYWTNRSRQWDNEDGLSTPGESSGTCTMLAWWSNAGLQVHSIHCDTRFNVLDWEVQGLYRRLA